MSFGLGSMGSEEYSWSPSPSSSTSSPALYLSCEDDFFTVLGRVSELFDRPPTQELPKGLRLSTVKTHLPQISYFNLSHLTRAPTIGDPDSSFDICCYYTRDNPEDDGQGSLATPSHDSSLAAAETFFGDVFKAFDDSYDSSKHDPVIDRQLQLLQREAPLRKLMRLTRTEVISNPNFEQTARDRFTPREYDLRCSDTSFFSTQAIPQRLYETPVRSRPQPFYGVSNSPLSLYTSVSFSGTPETMFKARDRDIFDDDDEFAGLPEVEFGKSHRPRLNLVKKFMRKVLAPKTNSDISFSSSDGYLGLSMNSWADSTGTLSGWTTISTPLSPLQSPMLRDEMWR